MCISKLGYVPPLYPPFTGQPGVSWSFINLNAWFPSSSLARNSPSIPMDHPGGNIAWCINVVRAASKVRIGIGRNRFPDIIRTGEICVGAGRPGYQIFHPFLQLAKPTICMGGKRLIIFGTHLLRFILTEQFGCPEVLWTNQTGFDYPSWLPHKDGRPAGFQLILTGSLPAIYVPVLPPESPDKTHSRISSQGNTDLRYSKSPLYRYFSTNVG